MAPTAPPKENKRRPTAREKARARLVDPLIPRKTHRPDNVVTDSFIDSKRDKRTIRHSTFVARIQKSSTATTRRPHGRSTTTGTSQKQQQQPLKKRRPSKKLVATLESLGDALADIQEEIAAEDAEGGGDAMDAEQAKQGRVRHRSLRTRPGALKRKEKIVRGEMERFGHSLARLVSVREDASGVAGGKDSNSTPGTDGQEGMDVDSGKSGKHVVRQAGETQEPAPAPVTSGPSSNRWAALRSFISATMEQNPAFLSKT